MFVTFCSDWVFVGKGTTWCFLNPCVDLVGRIGSASAKPLSVLSM
jgi:hypothetical protein